MAQSVKFIGALRTKHLSASSSPTLFRVSHRFNRNSSELSSSTVRELQRSYDSESHPLRLSAHGVMSWLWKGRLPGNGYIARGAMECRSFYSQAAASADASSSRVFAPYTVFKGKAALSISPVLPTFRKLDSGSHQLDRRGVLMLTFWPAIGERKYDWEKRQTFALSATEVGSLLCLGPQDSCEFFHDPSMKTSNAGQVRKSLSIKATADSSGYFFSLSVSNNISKTSERLTVPLTMAEFAVIRAASGFALPHILGWNRITYQPLAGATNSTKAAPLVKDIEWDR